VSGPKKSVQDLGDPNELEVNRWLTPHALAFRRGRGGAEHRRATLRYSLLLPSAERSLATSTSTSDSAPASGRSSARTLRVRLPLMTDHSRSCWTTCPWRA
jgi:hypothetical protein